ncbi:DNA-processing protein DprA [Ruegeria arenilitoris]|uniref:DNA-processing protein DprA n=1 Tax=Ruegeria arenilitoris TaxID=1173585 RepID=UPI00147D4CB1|nr:DNA-processing protein DprA [Ruegeria arenilitoris]
MTTLSPDTQATLLLIGKFTKAADVEPLSGAEYNKLAMQLVKLNLRPADMLQKLPEDLVFDTERLKVLMERGTALALAVERWSQLGIKIIGRGDDQYPSRLKAKLRGRAPPILYCAGNLDLLKSESVCVVGSRNASETGLRFAKNLGARCASVGLNVVSGDARGIDRAAMDSTINAGGNVTAVLVDALAKLVLAKRNRDPIKSGNLILVSPYDPDSGFTVAKAMDRNKYMYALGSAAIVVDSETKGGTWTGAIENQKQQWTQAFVRMDKHVALGNKRLVEMGLLPIDGAQGEVPENLREVLFATYQKQSPQLDLRTSKSTQFASDVQPSETSLFKVFLDLLEKWLAEGPQTDLAIAEHFCLEINQVVVWLNKAKNMGVVLELSEPKRFASKNEIARPSE